MKRMVLIVAVLGLVSYGYGIVIGDFEGGLDGWVAGWEGSPVLAASQTAGTVTTGASSLAVTTNGGYWCLQWNAPGGMIPASFANTTLKFDLTMVQSEWPASSWTKVADKIAVNSDSPSGWKEFTSATAEWRDGSGSAPLDWGAWSPTAAKTFSVDISSYDVTGATWLQIIITLQGGNGSGVFYFDNVQLVQPEPVSSWTRFECEDAVLVDTAVIGSDGDCSGGRYVSVQKAAPNWDKNGQIQMTVNAPRAGTYHMKIGQRSAGDNERYDNILVNGTTFVDQNFSGLIGWGAAAAIEGNNGWSEQAVIEDLFASVELYGSVDGNWQLWSRWAPAWDTLRLNKPMTVDLNEGKNTITIYAVWGWTNWDFIDVELGYIAKDPTPADGGIAIIGQDTVLSWTNAQLDLDKAEVWFGQTPEPNPADPNTYITSANYKDKLTLIGTVSNPKDKSSIAMPALTPGANYTWVVDGFKGVPQGGDPNYPGVFWTFLASDNIPPTANAGPDQFKWLNPASVVVTLDGSASTDDGKEGPLTYTWTQTAGPAVTLNSPASAITTVTLTQLGNTTEANGNAPYVFELKVDDGLWTATDAVTVHVNSNSCTASIEAGGFYYYGDVSSAAAQGVPDCKIDLYDFVEIASNWLGCSNIFEACQ